eukprot:3706015-Pleurochrysis_carterae.AAC.2
MFYALILRTSPPPQCKLHGQPRAHLDPNRSSNRVGSGTQWALIALHARRCAMRLLLESRNTH